MAELLALMGERATQHQV